LGKPVDEVFADFEDEPVGSGSIAQVHRATLRSTGDDVVIKVSHPNVRERIALDCACLRAVAAALDPFLPLIDLTAVMSQFEENLSVQVDLRFEAQNLVTFRDNFSHMPCGIQFPVPYPELATEKVLVESYMPGQPIADTIANGDLTPEGGRFLAKIGTDLFMQMLVTDNFFHADLHPGNMVVGHYANGKPYIGLLDMGITHTLSEHEQKTILLFMQGIQLRDPEHCASAILGMCDRGQPFCDEVKLRTDVRQLFTELMPEATTQNRFHSWLRKFGWIGGKEQGQITEVFSGLFDVARKNHVQLDAAYASLLFSTMMLEGMCNNMDPDFDLTRATLPWLLASPIKRFLGLNKRTAYVA
jgi:aarF domain-containing kinase